MKQKILSITLMLFFSIFLASTGIAGSNQISLNFGLKYDMGKDTKLLNHDSNEEGVLGNFAYSLQYTHFFKSNIGIGLDCSFSSLGSGENNAEGDVSAIPALISFRYYWLNGKIRPYSKIGAGALMGLLANSSGNETDEINELKNDKESGSEKYKLKLGYAGGAFVGVDWLFFKGLGANIETGILYENLPDKMFTNGKLTTTSILSRIGIFYQF